MAAVIFNDSFNISNTFQTSVFIIVFIDFISKTAIFSKTCVK